MNATITAASTALLSIDVQASFEAAPYWRDDDLPAFRERYLALASGTHRNGWPIVRILHEEDSGHFSRASGLVRPMDWVTDEPALEIFKGAHNAFTESGLDRWLRQRGIRRLVIAGIRTEQCCETNTRIASDLGYEVDFVTEATLTFPMTHARSGTEYTPDDIKRRTELVLDGRFARIATVDEVLAR
ncbi:MAG: isochorismatase family protein [Lysobacterales bacterium]